MWVQEWGAGGAERRSLGRLRVQQAGSPRQGPRWRALGHPSAPSPRGTTPPPVLQERKLSWPPAQGTEGGGQKDEVTGTEGVTCLQSSTHSQRHCTDTHAILWTDSPARRGSGRWGLSRQPAGMSGQQGGDTCRMQAAGYRGFRHMAQ